MIGLLVFICWLIPAMICWGAFDELNKDRGFSFFLALVWPLTLLFFLGVYLTGGVK